MGTRLLIIADVGEIVLSYNERRSLERVASISSEIPPDEMLMAAEIVMVLGTDREDRRVVIDALCTQARKCGGIPKIIGCPPSGQSFEATGLV